MTTPADELRAASNRLCNIAYRLDVPYRALAVPVADLLLDAAINIEADNGHVETATGELALKVARIVNGDVR